VPNAGQLQAPLKYPACDPGRWAGSLRLGLGTMDRINPLSQKVWLIQTAT
jgi:hypothetical protein